MIDCYDSCGAQLIDSHRKLKAFCFLLLLNDFGIQDSDTMWIRQMHDKDYISSFKSKDNNQCLNIFYVCWTFFLQVIQDVPSLLVPGMLLIKIKNLINFI